MMGLRTTDGLSESVEAGHVLWSIVMFGAIYMLLFAVWVFVLNEKIRHGPASDEPHEKRPSGDGFLAVSGAHVEPGGALLIDRQSDE